MDEYILEMRDIVKEFPGVRALKGVNLQVRPGTVHTLMGENGAGKSTLMKCLIGIHRPTSGKIIFNGQTVEFHAPIQALRAGISMIHQELSPVPERSVCENLWMGRLPMKGIIVDEKKMRQDALDLFQRLNLDLDPDKVSKEDGKGLSQNDFTNAFKSKLDGIQAGATANTVAYDAATQTVTLSGFSVAE